MIHADTKADKSFVIRIAFLTLAAIPIMLLVLGGKAPRTQSQTPTMIQRGQYLVQSGGCSACHTPKKMTPVGLEDDQDRFLSGHPEDAGFPATPSSRGELSSCETKGHTACVGPWGISYASNLTPDRNTGLGIWTEELFLRAMRTGKHYGFAADMLPPEGGRFFTKFSDDDLRAVFAYLHSLPPVRNHVPEPGPTVSRPGFDRRPEGRN